MSRRAGTVHLTLFLALVPAAPAMAGPGREVIHELNAARAEEGRDALRRSASLSRSARRYARWMARRDYFGHRARISASMSFSLVGETLAWHRGWRRLSGWPVGAWLHSSSHRRTLLRGRYDWIGVGRVRARYHGRLATFWVVHVGDR